MSDFFYRCLAPVKNFLEYSESPFLLLLLMALFGCVECLDYLTAFPNS
jgi:hypothetical protein